MSEGVGGLRFRLGPKRGWGSWRGPRRGLRVWEGEGVRGWSLANPLPDPT